MTTTSLAEALGLALLARGWRVTAAESCTGGGIASAITDIPRLVGLVRHGLCDVFQCG